MNLDGKVAIITGSGGKGTTTVKISAPRPLWDMATSTHRGPLTMSARWLRFG